MDGRLAGWMDGWMDGCMAAWLDGWMDGWLDGWITHVQHITYRYPGETLLLSITW